jgi:DNA helicase II / ATP-dependent DNA helicase PcrA
MCNLYSITTNQAAIIALSRVVKDMLALLRFVENPRNRVAGFRILHLLPGVGPASAQRVLDRMAESADPIGALCALPSPPPAGDDWKVFVQTVGNLRYSAWPADLERTRRWYEPHLDRVHEEDAEPHRADLIQLEQIASGYPSRERFLTELTLDPPDATGDQAGVPLFDEDYLILSTIHSAKGQEWKSVFVLNVVDGCMPSDLGAGTRAELEEEIRLLYVAMTRAKDDLHLTIPQRFFTHGQNAQGDRHVYASRTDSFRNRCFPCSNGRLGRLHRPARRVPPARVRASTSERACAACGAERIDVPPQAPNQFQRRIGSEASTSRGPPDPVVVLPRRSATCPERERVSGRMRARREIFEGRVAPIPLL